MSEPIERGDSLTNFLRGFSDFGRELMERTIELSKDDPDTIRTVRVLADTFVEATSQLAAHIGERFGSMDSIGRETVEQHLRLSGAMTLLASARAAIEAPGANSKISLSFIITLVHLLKKLIRAIFGALGIPFPKLLEALLHFIDELLEFLQHLLGGREASRFHHEMESRWLTILKLQAELAAVPPPAR